MKKFLIIILGIVLIFLVWLFYPLFSSSSPSKAPEDKATIKSQSPDKSLPKAVYNFPEHLKCPEDYETDEEYGAFLQELFDSFIADNPDASMKDILNARQVFYIKNNCQESLEKLSN